MAEAERTAPSFAPFLVDEISRAIFPAVDGAKRAPSVFDSDDDEAGQFHKSPLTATAFDE